MAESPYTSNSFTPRPRAACNPIMQASYLVALLVVGKLSLPENGMWTAN